MASQEKPRKKRYKPNSEKGSRIQDSRRNAVIAARMAGLSHRQIEKVTGVSRTAVQHALSQTEVKAMLERYRDDYRAMVPGAIALLHREMELKPTGKRHATSDQIKAAIEITKGAQVAVPRSQGELEVRRDRFSEMTDEELDYFIATGEEMPKGVVKPGNA